MWRDTATEEKCSYGATRTMLERMLAGFKDDLPEDLLLGDVEMIRWEIQLLVAWVEKFLQAEMDERRRLMQQLEGVCQDGGHAKHHPASDRFHEYRWN